VPPSPSRGSSSEREAGGSVGGGGASSGGTLASPGATIMDGWFETKICRRGTDGQLPTIDYKQNWGKHYCVLTSELTGSMATTGRGSGDGDGAGVVQHAFVLAGFSNQKAFQRRQAPEWLVRLATAAVSLDIANSSAGAIVISVRTSSSSLAGIAAQTQHLSLIESHEFYFC